MDLCPDDGLSEAAAEVGTPGDSDRLDFILDEMTTHTHTCTTTNHHHQATPFSGSGSCAHTRVHFPSPTCARPLCTTSESLISEHVSTTVAWAAPIIWAGAVADALNSAMASQVSLDIMVKLLK